MTDLVTVIKKVADRSKDLVKVPKRHVFTFFQTREMNPKDGYLQIEHLNPASNWSTRASPAGTPTTPTTTTTNDTTSTTTTMYYYYYWSHIHCKNKYNKYDFNYTYNLPYYKRLW